MRSLASRAVSGCCPALSSGVAVRRPRAGPCRAVALVEAGRKVRDVARDLGVTEQSIYLWRKQDRIDRGLEPGVTTAEQAELVAARRRIRELETELEVARRAVEILKEDPDPQAVRVNRA